MAESAHQSLPHRLLGALRLDPEKVQERLEDERRRPVITRTLAFFALAAFGTAWIPFYPIWMVLFLSVVLAGISMRFPVLTIILLGVLVSAAAAFQRPEFGLFILVLALVLSIASLFDWKFAYIILLSLFLSRIGFGFVPPLAGAMLLPAVQAVGAIAVSGVFMSILVTSANFNVLGYFVGPAHGSSFIVFTEPPAAAWAPQHIGGELFGIAQANPDVISTVLGANLGASMTPFIQIVVWCAPISASFSTTPSR